MARTVACEGPVCQALAVSIGYSRRVRVTTADSSATFVRGLIKWISIPSFFPGCNFCLHHHFPHHLPDLHHRVVGLYCDALRHVDAQGQAALSCARAVLDQDLRFVLRHGRGVGDRSVIPIRHQLEPHQGQHPRQGRHRVVQTRRRLHRLEACSRAPMALLGHAPAATFSQARTAFLSPSGPPRPRRLSQPRWN
jgi:hypothetical protein